MKSKDTIWFHGPCDRACQRVTKHKHLSTDPLDGTVTYRHRRPSFTIPTIGGEYSDLMSVDELIKRLLQCPPEARVSLEVEELMVVHNDMIATVINANHPSSENFNAQHMITGVSR